MHSCFYCAKHGGFGNGKSQLPGEVYHCEMFRIISWFNLQKNALVGVINIYIKIFYI